MKKFMAFMIFLVFLLGAGTLAFGGWLAINSAVAPGVWWGWFLVIGVVLVLVSLSAVVDNFGKE